MTNILQIIFSAVVTLSTVIYSVLTWKLVSETRKIRKFQITPDVNIYFERSEADASFVHIVFKNSGLGHAKNVKFRIIQDFKFYDFSHLALDQKGIIKNGIDNFYSNQCHRFYFTDLSKNHAEKQVSNLTIEVSYYSIDNAKTIKEFNLSLSDLQGTSVFTPPDNYIGRIAYELKEIKNLLKQYSAKEE